MNKTSITLYILAIAAVFYIKIRNTPKSHKPVEWQAGRALFAGQQLKRSDLCPNTNPVYPADSLVGRHLVQEKRKDDIINSADVSLLPQLPDSAKDTIVWMLVLRPQEKVWNELVGINAIVQLCAPEQQEKSSMIRCVDQLPVIAIHQASDSSQSSFWLIRLPANRAAEAAFLQAAKERSISVRFTGQR